jgi:ribosomal protein S9
MAWTAATSQATVEAAREALIKATQQIELYMQVNSPGLLAQADAAVLAASTAITTLRT